MSGASARLSRAQTAQVAGHFGEWMQGRLGPEGPIALVTVPCPSLSLTLAWTVSEALQIIQPDPPVLSTERAYAFLQALGQPTLGRIEVIQSFAPRRGTGASTAVLVALAQACGVTDAGQIAAACRAVEGASDPLMIDAPGRALWAPREGRTLRTFGAEPNLEIVGGFLGAGETTDPADTLFPDISDLVPAWAEALANGDHQRLAACASASAQRTTALRGPADDPIASLAQDLGALGYLRAHTGSARGLIYAPGSVPADAMPRLAAAGLAEVMRFRTTQIT